MARTKDATKRTTTPAHDISDDAMDVDEHVASSSAPARPSGANHSTNTRKVSNQTSKPRVTSGSAAKTQVSATVVDLEEEDDSEVEVAVQAVTKTPSSKGKERASVSNAPAKYAKPSSTSRTNGHASEDASRSERASAPISNGSRRDINRSQETWQTIVDQLQEQAQNWEKKFTELARARNAAPEESLDLFKAEAEQRIETLQQENEHLRAQMPHFSDLSNTGRRSMITLLTEEGTNTRIRQYADQVRDLKNAIAERDAALAESIRQLEACQTELETLQADLKVEVKHNQQLDAQNKALKSAAANISTPARPVQPSPSPRSATQDATICLYEDMTKILVTDCKLVSDNVFRFSCAAKNANDPDTSLQFSLLNVTAPPQSTGGSDAWYMYTPVERSAFSDELLGYFGSQFRFPREQTLDLTLQLLEILEYDVARQGGDDTTENDVSVDPQEGEVGVGDT